jgi:acetylornithine deacetylase/succinyl-diaminopimelate desuccinylase-like protein
MRAKPGLVMLCSLVTLVLTVSVHGVDFDAIREWRASNEKALLAEFVALLGLPNHALDTPNIEANATAIAAAFEARGVPAKLLRIDGAPPIVFAEWAVPGATRTVAFYAHYDGQPVASQPWTSEPFVPVMRGGDRLDSPTVDWEAAPKIDPEWRLYARASGDDKVSIVALLNAVSALKATGTAPSVNVKFVFEGEEERGSPHLAGYLEKYADELAVDAWLLCDGPVHQSRRMQLPFGARGVTGVDLTVYGPNKGLHSGHYGNWAPNPIVTLAHLLTKMRDEEANILIEGFYDDVRPVTPAERKAIDDAPDVDDALREEFGLARTEGSGALLLDQIMKPTLNVRGIRAGDVGANASNVIVPTATASIDFRLVPDQTPTGVEKRVNAWLETSGYHLVTSDPDVATRAAHPRIVKVEWKHSYPPYRTSLDDPFAKDVVRAVKDVVGDDLVIIPTLGGSIPMHLFAGPEAKTPVIIVPIANHDNNQHAANENIRLQNLWDGIEVYAALMTNL